MSLDHLISWADVALPVD